MPTPTSAQYTTFKRNNAIASSAIGGGGGGGGKSGGAALSVPRAISSIKFLPTTTNAQLVALNNSPSNPGSNNYVAKNTTGTGTGTGPITYTIGTTITMALGLFKPGDNQNYTTQFIYCVVSPTTQVLTFNCNYAVNFFIVNQNTTAATARADQTGLITYANTHAFYAEVPLYFIPIVVGDTQANQDIINAGNLSFSIS
jgi:hypothetical protein